MSRMTNDMILSLRGRGDRPFKRADLLWVSRGGSEPPAWVTADSVRPGDFLGIRYGADWSAVAPMLPALPNRALYGSEKAITVPKRLNADLAFFLGAYLSEGHRNRSNWSVVITNSVNDVLERVQAACTSAFGLQGRIVRPADKCPGFVVSSKRLVEFLDLLDCGSRASDKRVPGVLFASPMRAVLSFLQGVALDGYTTHKWAGKWAICLESRTAIDGIQDLMTMLGVANAQIPKLNKQMNKTYYELYAAGPWGQEMVRLVPFLEPDKASRAAEYLLRDYATGATDLIPGITGPELHALVPRGVSGRRGRGTGRQALRHLCDPRTTRVSRHSVQKALAAGAVLPPWLEEVLRSDTRFVEAVGRAAE